VRNRAAKRHPHDVDDGVSDSTGAGIGRLARRYVKFNGTQVDMVFGGVVRHLGYLRCIAPLGFAHAGIHGVAGAGQCAGRAPKPFDAPAMTIVRSIQYHVEYGIADSDQ
jgi:hypothetical protein